MKLYSLTINKRLIKSIIQKTNIIISFLFIGAIILIFGSFFYSQDTFAKSMASTTLSSTNKISIKKTNFTSPKTKLPIKQSKYSTPVKLSQLKKELDIKTISLQNKNIQENNILKNNLTEILVDTPMENMIEVISRQDKLVAAFLVGIALKESQFGKHSPKLHGQDCYNYWGYRGKRPRMGTGGHTCFDSPEDAVETVAKRIKTLAITQHRDTPQKMLIWKCGSDCNTAGGWPAANKWVSDVSIYFNKINN